VGEFLIDVATLQWAYFGLLIAFTICLALLLPLTSASGLRWWLLSNLTTAAAMPVIIWRSATPDEQIAYLLPATLVVTSAALKLLAVSSRSLRRRLKPILALSLGLFACTFLLLDQISLASTRLALVLMVLSFLTGAIAFAARQNPLWAGAPGRHLLFLAFLISSIVLAVIAYRSMIGSSTSLYFSQGKTQSLTFAYNIIQIIVVHIGFMAVLVGRLAKVSAFKAARQKRLIRSQQLAEQHAAQMERLAVERHALLDLLSHEVRQPLNNAQAVLQDISRTIGERKLTDLGMSQPILSLYNTIDHVVLALSNAIVGASVIERRTEQARQLIDVTALAELARGDCPLDEQPRVLLGGETDPVFLSGDPVVLRLAFRNLLDNACKFATSRSQVAANVRIDEDRLGVVFEVFNNPAVPFTPHDYLFDRDQRGSAPNVAGKGLGLFIVREAAEMHDGATRAYIAPDGRTCFEIFLPL
jgi:signal transduction histidine kinase